MCNVASMSILSLFLDLSMLLMWLTDLLLKFWLEQSIVLRLEDEAPRWRDRRELSRPADTVIMFEAYWLRLGRLFSYVYAKAQER